MECKFVVGQKVVCVADAWFSLVGGYTPPRTPIKDQTYTVERIVTDDGHVLLYLREMMEDDCRWHHIGFRPLQEGPKEADTDISVFTPLLNTTKTPELV